MRHRPVADEPQHIASAERPANCVEIWDRGQHRVRINECTAPIGRRNEGNHEHGCGGIGDGRWHSTLELTER
jgi:hypothetical protein